MKKISLNKYTSKFIWACALMFGLFAFSSNASAQLINELLVNPNGSDSNCEYAEIIGTPSGSLTNIYFASIEGDGTSTVGAFDRVVDLSASTIGSNGFLVITNDASGDCTRTYNTPMTTRVQVTGFSMENGTNSWALISSPTTTIDEGTDYDTNNDGTLDALPGDAVILDAVGFNDGGGSDVTFGAELVPTAGGGADMATRFPGNTDATSVGAWYYGDMDGDNTSVMYDLTQVSGNFPTGGMLTPGDANVGGSGGGGSVHSDFDGDGTTDYSIFRNSTPPGLQGKKGNLGLSIKDRLDILSNRRIGRKAETANTNKLGGAPMPGNTVRWFISNSGDSSVTITDFGDFTNDDFITPADFDGDGKADLSTWRGVSTANPDQNGFFFIMNSSDSTVDVVDFGIDGDNPTVVGDYDGDGKADPAVYRCDGPPFAQCTFFYRGSAGMGEITFFDWGNDVDADVSANPGDFDGDGKYDFCVHQQVPGTNQGQFILFRSSDGGIEYINWGIRNTSSGDFVVPGDFDGDGQNDFMVVRVEGSAVNWYLLEKDGGGTGASPITFGTTAIAGSSEFLTTGDFDGDGAADVAIWRRDNTDPDNTFFYVLRSSDGMLQTFEWGATTDNAVPGWNIQ